MAQYVYLFHERHQSVTSMIEAVALDVGMAIFSLLALGLARAGKSARVERVLILACAAGSALMNFAASDATSARSVLAYTMPPIFLAIVVDRVIAVVRRHMLGDEEGSPWSAFGRFTLYALRFVLAPPSTATGLRRYVLLATPVPSATVPEVPAAPAPKAIESPVLNGTARRPAPRGAQAGSKTHQFLDLVVQERGPLAEFPLADVSRTCTDLAPKVGLDTGSARAALRKAVLAAQDGGQS